MNEKTTVTRAMTAMTDRGDTGRDGTQIWSSLLEQAERELGIDCVAQWLRPLNLTLASDEGAVITANTGFLADWVERNFGLHLLRMLQSRLPALRR